MVGDRRSKVIRADCAVVGGDRAIVGDDHAIVGRDRAGVGENRSCVGGDRAVVGRDGAGVAGERSGARHDERGTGAIGIADSALYHRILRGSGHYAPWDGACGIFKPVFAVIPVGVLRLMEIERGRCSRSPAGATHDAWKWAAAKHD